MSDYFTDDTSRAGDQNNQPSMLQNADAMILANGQADAQEIQDLKSATAQYQSQLNELKALYQKSLQQLDAQQQRNAQIVRSNAQTISRIQDLLEDLSAKAEAAGHIDWSSLEKHADDAAYEAGRKAVDAVNEASKEIAAQVAGVQDKLSEQLQQSDDFSHKENVRVYRNVQAATDQLLRRQTDELRVDINASRDSEHAGRRHNGVGIAALVVSLITLAYVVCDSLGIVQMIIQLF